jgi:hypothetical protein
MHYEIAQLVHNRFTLFSPFVLKKSHTLFLYSTADRDQTVSQRFEPSSRITLISEQLNPWYHFQHQDVMSRHRGAKLLRRYEL